MLLFLVGLAILIVGGFFYGKFCEKVFGPDDRKTPAVAKADGVDYVVMKSWKNQLIELLNIAGTGPIFGPIQGILFGPIAFLTIPIGCVLAGSLHDYFVGMISMRNDGAQVPKLMKRYAGKTTNKIYMVVICVLMLLTGVVFIYTPGDLIVHDILGLDPSKALVVVFIVYACILAYYVLATLFPIDMIIGKVYPIFGAFLILSAIGVFIGTLADGGKNLHVFTTQVPILGGLLTAHPSKQSFIPVFFVTVACGILSGFHGSQATLISRTVKSEYEGKKTFFNMMLVEGFIAMVWAAGAMVLFNRHIANPDAYKNVVGFSGLETAPTLMVGIVSKEFMGKLGGLIAIIGVIVLPITSGDTAFRSLRLMIAEQFGVDQKSAIKRVTLSVIIFIPAVAILIYAKLNSNGFNTLWQYFGFTNQLVAVFALLMISIYLKGHGKNYYLSLLPGCFYTFIVTSYIFHSEKLGFRLDKLLHMDKVANGYIASYVVGVIAIILFVGLVNHFAKTREKEIVDDNYKEEA